MKTIFIFILLLSSLVFSKTNQITNENNLNKKYIINEKLTKKELNYQKYLVKLEEENKKLQEDGFCDCNYD